MDLDHQNAEPAHQADWISDAFLDGEDLLPKEWVDWIREKIRAYNARLEGSGQSRSDEK